MINIGSFQSHQRAKLISYFFPRSMVTKKERIQIYLLLDYLLATIDLQPIRFKLIPTSYESYLTKLRASHQLKPKAIRNIFKRLQTSRLLSAYPLLSALTSYYQKEKKDEQFNNWFGLVLLSSFQLFVFGEEEAIIKKSLHQIRLIATNEKLTAYLNTLPSISKNTLLETISEMLTDKRLNHQDKSNKRHIETLDSLLKKVLKSNANHIRTPHQHESKKASYQNEEARKRSMLQGVMLANTQQQKIINRNLSLACDYENLTRHEVAILVNYCNKQIKNTEAGWLLLSLLTGRKIENLYDDKIQFDSFFDQVYFQLNHQVPASFTNSDLKAIVTSTTSTISIPLPKIFEYWITTKQYQHPIEIKKINSIIQRLNKKHSTRLSLIRISGYLNHFLLNEGIDDAIIDFLRNRTYKNNPALAYSCIEINNALAIHETFTKHVFDAADLPLEMNRSLISVEAFTGTSLKLDENICYKLFTYLSEQINAIDDHWKFHNQFVFYVWALLSFSTGHRDVNAPMESIKDYDEINGTWIINDKESRHCWGDRMIVLPKTAQEQIQYYLSHLRALSIKAHFIEPELKIRCLDAISGNQNLLFAVMENKGRFVATDLTPSVIETLHASSFPLPHNWGRHHLRSSLMQKNVHADLINAWMGHEEEGKTAFGQFSGLAINDLHFVAQIIESLLKEYEIKAVSGWITL